MVLVESLLLASYVHHYIASYLETLQAEPLT